MVDLSPLFTPEFQRDPHPFLHELRAQAPVLPLEQVGSWVVTSYPLVRSVLCDARFRSGFGHDFEASGGGNERWRERSPTTWRFATQAMLFRNGPDHARLRRLVSRAFTPRVIERLRPRVEARVDELLDGLVPKRGMNLVADFAYPLPLTVIAELLGFPGEDRDDLKRWSQPITQILDGLTRAHKLEEAEAAAAELDAYLAIQLARHRERPGDDLIDGLLDARDAGDRLSEPELLATCTLLLIAGHETTTNLLAGGVLALLRQRDAWERLCAEPQLLPSAVEELLRHDTPVQFTARRTVGALELGGLEIPDDREVLLVLSAANRDPAQFPDPDRLDVARTPNDHLAFALGTHFCLGAALARMEAQVALRALVRWLPGLALAEEPESLAYRPGFAIRALAALPVRW